MTNYKKYILAQDNSCHWFLIPFENKAEFDEWLEIDEDDERSWTPPEFARSIDGPHMLTFENPIEE